MPPKLEQNLIHTEPKETLVITVVYEDTLTRDRAMLVCDELVQQFWAQVDFDVSWWRESYLADSNIAMAAADSALKADMIMLSMHAAGELSPRLTNWIETWLEKRGEREAALVGLIGTPNDASAGLELKDRCLSEIAERGKLDYLSSVLPATSQPGDDSIDSIHRRADQITSVLDQILHYSPTHQPPSGGTPRE